MFQPWRYQLREAQEAFAQGRLEDTERLLAAADLVQYLPGKVLLANLANALVRRASHRGSTGNFLLAWRDLKKARDLGGQTDAWLAAREELIQFELEVLQNHLRASDHSGALVRLEELGRRDLAGVSVTTLKEMVQRLDTARRLLQHGKFAAAQDSYAAAVALRGDLAVTRELLARSQKIAEEAQPLHEALHRAVAAGDWSEALRLSDQLLRLTPLCPIANEARRRAWEEVGAKTPEVTALPLASGSAATARRGMVWVDGVGGYLLCLADSVTIGQAFPGTEVAVPIQADLAREHLRLRRDGEGYLVEPLAPKVACRGKVIREPTLLVDGDELELGSGVRIRFHKPHVLSSSARIDFLSRHRPRPFADGVILMGESCVLGPALSSHIVCREWSKEAVIYRHQQQLGCRCPEPFEIDGVRHEGRGKLTWSSHVAGADFSFKLEAT